MDDFQFKKRNFKTENHNICQMRMKCDQSIRSANLSMLNDNHNYKLNIMYWLCLSCG